MRAHANRDDQIAGWATHTPWGAVTGDTNLVTVVSPFGHAHGHLLATILQGQLELRALERGREVDRHLADDITALGRRVRPGSPVPPEQVSEKVAEACTTRACAACTTTTEEVLEVL